MAQPAAFAQYDSPQVSGEVAPSHRDSACANMSKIREALLLRPGKYLTRIKPTQKAHSRLGRNKTNPMLRRLASPSTLLARHAYAHIRLTPPLARRASTLPPTIRQLLSAAEAEAREGADRTSAGKGAGTSAGSAGAVEGVNGEEGREVEVTGWVRSVRRQKRVAFAVLSDGSTRAGLQAVFGDPAGARALTNGASVRVRGRLVASPGAGQARELRVSACEVVGACDPEVGVPFFFPLPLLSPFPTSPPPPLPFLPLHPLLASRSSLPFPSSPFFPSPVRLLFIEVGAILIEFGQTYPLQKQALPVDYTREHAHLRARTDEGGRVLRVRAAAARAVHAFFEGEGFVYAHTPVLTANDCEGAGEAFRIAGVSPSSPSPVTSATAATPTSAATMPTPATPTPATEFFGRPAYLSVSSQLHLEALASGLARVYTLAPAFRAERSQTARHLAEFWMLEAEWAFAGSVGGLCDVVEGAVKAVAADAGVQGEVDAARLAGLVGGGRWARMSYTDAVAVLEKAAAAGTEFAFAPAWGRALQSEHERWLAEALVGGPVFVTDYPAGLKPFYMRANGDGGDAGTVACFDLLVPRVGELVGGSLREERVGRLERALDAHGLGREAYGWYVDLRRYGGAPHGGFGLGFERLVAWLTGIDNVRECIPVPRWAGRMLL
ncbi:hypothetical protein HWV62_22576 [Athelia sp. TMB]|nr:hypothetical protein HWV62_22576 [Athelia sp. TMB]